jgi:GRAM domain-containing protein 4
MPPPLKHSPTDAEYAMELISQRVARGLPVHPRRRKRQTPFGSRINPSVEESLENRRRNVSRSNSVDKHVDWNKWGDRVVRTKAWAGDVKQVFTGDNWKSLDNWTAVANPLGTRGNTLPKENQSNIETHCEFLLG